MGAIFIAVLLSLGAYLLAVTLIPKHLLIGSSAYTHNVLNRLRAQNLSLQKDDFGRAPKSSQQDGIDDNTLVRAFLLIPGISHIVPFIQRADIWEYFDRFVLAMLLFFLVVLFYLLSKLGIFALPVALVITWMVGWVYLRRRIKKRRTAFLGQFPEAVDSIVRSVKVGQSLVMAIRSVGEGMEEPTSSEFKRVHDEISHGVSMYDALNHLADRVDDADVRFFAVVLTVQQESGGNIAESLSNISSVLRKRRQFRLKVRSLSSEGRATAWIIGSIPFVILTILHFSAPEHLAPLITTSSGNIAAAVAFGMLITGVLIIWRIVNIKV